MKVQRSGSGAEKATTEAIATPITVERFAALWAEHPASTYPYSLNPRALLLYFVMLVGIWSFWSYEASTSGIDVPVGVVGGVFGLVTIGALVNLVYWLRVRSRSGVICTPTFLAWWDRDEAFQVPWTEVDFDELGLTNLRAYRSEEFNLTIRGRTLCIYRPHLRLKNTELFLGAVFQFLKAEGRIPTRPPKESKR
ncbi:MAG: hypothetical protein IV100_27825 [Myxococcales bacterium]|nr:hypothetical protein [Myxococcales bacterium]